MTGDAAMVIGGGLRDMDDRMTALAVKIDTLEGAAPDLAALHADLAASANPSSKCSASCNSRTSRSSS